MPEQRQEWKERSGDTFFASHSPIQRQPGLPRHYRPPSSLDWSFWGRARKSSLIDCLLPREMHHEFYHAQSDVHCHNPANQKIPKAICLNGRHEGVVGHICNSLPNRSSRRRLMARNTIPHVRCNIAEKALSALAPILPVAVEDVKATVRAEAVAVAGMKKDAATVVPAAVPLW